MTEITPEDVLDEKSFEAIWAFVMQYFGEDDESLEKAVVAMRTVSAILEAELGLPEFEVNYRGDQE